MSVCTFLGKYVLYLFNLLCLISGVGILTIAAIVYNNSYKWSNFLKPEAITTPQILLAIGFGLFVIAVVGLCAVLRDNGCLLTLFSVLLTIVLIGELLFSGVVYFKRDDVEQYSLNQMNSTLAFYNTTGHETMTNAWDMLQNDMQCCGIMGPSDWSKVNKSDKLPFSCCHSFPLNGFCTLPDSFKDGCFDKLKSTIQENSNILIWTAIGIAIVQVVAVFLASCRTVLIQKEYETV